MDIIYASLRFAVIAFAVIAAVQWLTQFIPSRRVQLDSLFRSESGQIQMLPVRAVHLSLLARILHYPLLRGASYYVLDRSSNVWVGTDARPTPSSMLRRTPMRARRHA